VGVIWSTDHIVSQALHGVGSLIREKVDDDRLPPVPELAQKFALEDSLQPGLCLHGPHESGKTWIGLWVARELGRRGFSEGVAYWTVSRFIQDYEWFQNLRRDRYDFDGDKSLEYQAMYHSYCWHPLLMLDKIDYTRRWPSHVDALWDLIEERIEKGLRTIIVLRNLPEVDSAAASVLRSSFVVVQCGEG
jgi:hypothetical protein